jgi:hypothetical protein
VNPILYGLTNEKFRDGYRKVLHWNMRVSDADKTLSQGKQRNSQIGQGYQFTTSASDGTKIPNNPL